MLALVTPTPINENPIAIECKLELNDSFHCKSIELILIFYIFVRNKLSETDTIGR